MNYWEAMLISFVANLVVSVILTRWAFLNGYQAGSTVMTEYAKQKMDEYHDFAIREMRGRFR